MKDVINDKIEKKEWYGTALMDSTGCVKSSTKLSIISSFEKIELL